MTTKLYGGDKRLYTAAEARRIDIERGGEGRIRHIEWREVEDDYILLDVDNLKWTSKVDSHQIALLDIVKGEDLDKEKWLPLTPEQEQESKDGELNLESLLRRKCDEIEQLEKENAQLRIELEQVYIAKGLNDTESLEKSKELAKLEKELAEATNNYHEILAEHGELTRQFDEMKEKQLSKEDFQLIQIGRLILEVNKRAWELREADL